jgi:hypothetical protein
VSSSHISRRVHDQSDLPSFFVYARRLEDYSYKNRQM